MSTFKQLKEFADRLGPKGTEAFEEVCRSAYRDRRLEQLLEARLAPHREEFVRLYRKRFGSLPDWMREELPSWGPRGFQLLIRLLPMAESYKQYVGLYRLAEDVMGEGRMYGYRRIFVRLIEHRFGLDAFLDRTICLLAGLADATQLDCWFQRLFEVESVRDIFGGALDLNRYLGRIESVDELLRR